MYASSDTPWYTYQGFLVQRGGSPISLPTERWRPSLPKRSQNRSSTSSRVPHGTVHTEFPPVERGRQAVRRVCAPLRDSTLALSLFLGQHGRVFTRDPSSLNPPKRDSVVQGTYVYCSTNVLEMQERSEDAGRGVYVCGRGLFIPRLERRGLSSPILCNDALERSLYCDQTDVRTHVVISKGETL